MEEIGVHHPFGKDHPPLPMLQVKRRPWSSFGRSIPQILSSGGATGLMSNHLSLSILPDLKHKVTRKADGWSTPSQTDAMLKLVTRGKLQPYVGYHTRGCRDIPPPNRVRKNNNGTRNTQPSSTAEARQTVEVHDASVHMKSANAMSEAISVPKSHDQQGITRNPIIYIEVLQKCFKQKDFVLAKQVHYCIIKCGMDQNMYVANNLMRVYNRCGRLQDARQVFDKLVKKNVFSWTIMIGGYAEHGHAEDAFEVFNLMRQTDSQPDEITYLSILKVFASPLALKWGKEVHAHIRHGSFHSDVRVGTALLKMYAKCGSIEEARQVFDKLTNHDVVSWTVMIGAYAESGHGPEAYGLFLQMQQEGCIPDAFTYSSMLNQQASAGALEWLKDVHAHALKTGFESDVRVANGLINMYSKCGCVSEARQVFDRMVTRSVISWNVMIGAYVESGCGAETAELFLQMQREGFKPDAFTYMSVLKACARVGPLDWVKEVHSLALKAGLVLDLQLGNALVHSYAKSGSIYDSWLVFDRMVDRDVITWTLMIGGLAQHGLGHEAYSLFLEMQRRGSVPNAFTFVSILNPCASTGALEWVKEVHSHALKLGLESDLRVGNAIVHMYAKSGSINDARLVFNRMVDRDVITWTVMIGGLAEHSLGLEAFSLFLQMQREGLIPDALTYVSILSPCASGGALEWVKEVHSHALIAGLELDVRVGTAFVHMYAKSGSIDNARLVFDRMVDRNVITWNVMIGGLAQHRLGHEAFSLFLQMQEEGFKPDALTYVNILNPCASEGALDWVKEVHSSALKEGLDLDVRVANGLINMYAKCGSFGDARLIFDRMVDRDVVTWTMMIGGLAQHGLGHEAFSFFLQMQREGIKPDAITYASILNPSASAGSLEWVKELLRHAFKSGLQFDLRVRNAFVQMYARIGRLDEAQRVFDSIVDRNVITWTAMIGGLAQHGLGNEAFSLFLQMQQEGFKPDGFTYVSILNPCAASTGALEWVKQVHSHALQAGLESDLRVGNAFVHMYVKSGSIDDARLVFDRLMERDVITWNIMIGGLAQHGLGHEAFSLFLQMQREGLKPDAFTYASILNACASNGALGWVKEVHSHTLEAGLESDLRVGSALVHMYAKSGSIDDARLVFDRMVDRDVMTWNIMIGGLAQHGLGHEAFSLFLQMQQEGFKPDAITYMSLLDPCASAGAFEWVHEVHSYALEAGLESDLRVGSAFVHMFAKSGSIVDAQLVFDRMVERDVVTWNMMIGGLAEYGLGHEALQVYEQMKAKDVTPDDFSFVAVLSACSHAGLIDEGRHLFQAITVDYGREPTMAHHTCMVDLLGRAGCLEEAKLFICNMPLEPDAATWGALLGACRTHGNLELAELAAREHIKLKPEDASAYVLLSNMYAAAGKWNQVSIVRTMMQERGIYKEPGRSWIEVDNRTHCFVVGDRSHPEAREIYAELSVLTQQMKAEGYIPDTRLVLHNIDDQDKELALCSHSEKLAIAYGLMHTPPGKPIRIYKNLQVCSDCHTATKFISKVTGREIVARDANRFHHFKDGRCSCGDYW